MLQSGSARCPHVIPAAILIGKVLNHDLTSVPQNASETNLTSALHAARAVSRPRYK
jgi:hypothetical protein